MDRRTLIAFPSLAARTSQRLLNEPAAGVPAEGKFQSLVANLAGVVWTAVLGGRTTCVQGNVEEICAFTAEDILASDGNIWVDRIHPEDSRRVLDAYSHFASTRSGFDAEYRWQRGDGKWIWLHSRAVIRSGADPAIVDGIVTDITGRKQLEMQVQQLQRMETIGQFAGGIAHDFNNLLAVILGNNAFLLSALPHDDPRREDAEAIGEAAERAALLTRQLLTFSRRQSFDAKVLNVNTLIEGVERMLRRVLTENINFSIALTHGIGNVLAEEGQVEQVVMNLVANARDAMPHGGTLSVATSQVEFGEGDTASGLPAMHGAYVRLTVRDTGCGMDAETRTRVFEPFFTTKEHGKGTGLGLSTCHAIVKHMGGHLWVDSEPGRGSVFTAYLPSVDRNSSATSKGIVTTNRGGGETILVVEDDERLLTLVQRVLARLGYHVLAARDGQEALDVARSYKGDLHLILSDVIVPDLCGVEIVNRVRERFTGARSLFMSGHTNHALLHDGILQDGAEFIQKPFLPDALARKVRDVLDGSLTPGATREHVQT